MMEEIKHIKNNMNKLRVEFVFPQDYKIKLNDYWVLGFIEGEGSFSIVKKNNYKLRFSVGQSSKDRKKKYKYAYLYFFEGWR